MQRFITASDISQRALDRVATEAGRRSLHVEAHHTDANALHLVISHDLAPMRVPIDTHEHSRSFDPDAFVQADEVAAVLTRSPEWAIETHEKRPRPPGAASAQHHVDDVVLRARRRASLDEDRSWAP